MGDWGYTGGMGESKTIFFWILEVWSYDYIKYWQQPPMVWKPLIIYKGIFEWERQTWYFYLWFLFGIDKSFDPSIIVKLANGIGKSGKQWAAVKMNCGSTRLPPHLCSSLFPTCIDKDTVHGHCWIKRRKKLFFHSRCHPS